MTALNVEKKTKEKGRKETHSSPIHSFTREFKSRGKERDTIRASGSARKQKEKQIEDPKPN